MLGAALFDTSIGRCAIAWRDETVTAFQLPERTDSETIARLLAKLDGPTLVSTEGCDPDRPPLIQQGIDGVIALLDGEPIDLSFIEIDLEQVSQFERAVYAVTRAIGPGQSVTYGQVATAIGEPGAAQAVGKALGANPIPVIVPCHRVLGADGKLTGFSANGGIETKRRMLLIEGCPEVPPSLFD